MTAPIDGIAIVYCEGVLGTTYGKTGHGLIRHTRRYRVSCVVDSGHSGDDAGLVLDGKIASIPVVADLPAAIEHARTVGGATHFVVGVAPDGGRLDAKGRAIVADALRAGLNVDSGLHEFFSEDPEFVGLARSRGVTIRDIRKPPARENLHFFSGKIEEVGSFRVAVLGTDSAVGKRTTAWLLVDALVRAGRSAEMIGTGQTAWLQGAEYSIVLDSLINDFVSGEIEHAVVRAWEAVRPDVLVLEGQGSLMNPAYPGGFELLAAGRPHVVVLQHAPARREYDGFPGYPLHPLPEQIRAIELLSGKPVVAITVNHEDLNPDDIAAACARVERETGLPTCDVLIDGADRIVEAILPHIERHAASQPR